MIVEPPQPSRRSVRFSAERELAIGLVVLSVLAALLLTYFLGFYCSDGAGWPCTPAFTSDDAGDGSATVDEAPGGAPGPAQGVPPPLVPSELFPPTETQPAPPTAAVPTAAPATSTPSWTPTSDTASETGTPTSGSPSRATSTPTSTTDDTGESTSGVPTNTLMPGSTASPEPTSPGGYAGPSDPTATPDGYP